MDEKHYKQTYTNINPNRCVFEKAINSRVCNCNISQRFNLADREGVACTSKSSLDRCTSIINRLHENARFVLQRMDVKTLGHAQEIKIQNGGLLGLQYQLIDDEAQNVKDNVKDKVNDIDAVITAAEKKYISIDEFPYSKIVQVINEYSIRPKRTRLKKDR
jgi:hypothetical protein